MQNFYFIVVFFLMASYGMADQLLRKEVYLEENFPKSSDYDLECPWCPKCPDCPQNYIECHIKLHFDVPCPCSTCLTRCYARDSVCEKGESCILEDVYYDNTTVGQTAVCKPFKECHKEECSSQCPMSGFFVDVNGCQTCLCDDPCKELKCKGECRSFYTNPGMEPYYFCAS